MFPLHRFLRSPLGLIGLLIVMLYLLLAIYAPLLASSEPLVIEWNNEWYFPLFKNLFYTGFYTKAVDIFFNLMIFTFPLGVVFYYFTHRLLPIVFLQIGLFIWLWFFPIADPSSDPYLLEKRQVSSQQRRSSKPSWNYDLSFLNRFGQLNLVIEELRLKHHDQRIQKYASGSNSKLYTPYLIKNEQLALHSEYASERKTWLDSQQIGFILWPLIREFHWQDDAGGDQSLNQKLPWWEVTRINRKDLVASLLFGIRISLMVGIMSIAIAVLIGVPIGALAGFFAGKTDIVISRLLEIWEAMPSFFMLLLIVAITQSKSIFLVIAVIGIFGWTTFSRYIRGEFLKERSLPYVESCKVLGFSPVYTMFKHVLPNAIPPLLTLLPFAILGAITSEAGLSFLGLGEEGSTSWGVLMDEGRQAFPGESYLLWPPAILLTILLIAIALVGDALRDALDPRSEMN